MGFAFLHPEIALLITIDPDLHATVGGGQQSLGGRFVGETVAGRVDVSACFGEKWHIHPFRVHLRRVIESVMARGLGRRWRRSIRRCLPRSTKPPQYGDRSQGCRKLILMSGTPSNSCHQKREEKIMEEPHGVTFCNLDASKVPATASVTFERAASAVCRAISCFALRRSRLFLLFPACAVGRISMEATAGTVARGLG